MAHHDLALFALRATRAFGEAVAAELGVALAEHEERSFEDGGTRPGRSRPSGGGTFT